MFEILGYENLSFTNPDTGELVNGSKVYLKGQPVNIENGNGDTCLSKFFLHNRIQGKLEVGAFCEFAISFNSKGEPKVTGLKISN